MRTLIGEKKFSCLRCGARLEQKESYCLACNQKLINQIDVPRRQRKAQAFAAATLYVVSGVYFVLGMLDGFVGTNSLSMTANFVVSLFVLSLAPIMIRLPFSTAFTILVLNVATQLVFPSVDIFFARQWAPITMLLLFAPLSSIIFSLVAKRLDFKNR